MGDCRRGFRGYLDELQEAGAEQKALAFNYIKTANVRGILALLEQYPGLLKQASDDEHKANLIISILFEIRSTRSKRNHDALLGLLHTIIAKHKDKLDLTFQDKHGNTALHRAFWYAITSENAETSEALTDIGIEFLKLIKNATHFRQIMALKNVHNESFVQNIYLGDIELSLTQQQHLAKVQNNVAPLLNPYKRKAGNGNGVLAPIDFNAQSFKERLEELLTDPITFCLLENPVLFIKEGHTLDKATWASLNPKQNPLTRTVFKDSELQPNKTIATILALFRRHGEDEKQLVASLNQFFRSQQVKKTVDDFFLGNPDDVLTQDIKALVDNYNRQYRPANNVDFVELDSGITPSNSDSDLDVGTPLISTQSKGKKLPQTPNLQSPIIEVIDHLKLNITNKTSGRETWFDTNTDSKVAKLDTISNWLKSKDSLNPAEKNLILALVRDVCAIKRNSWGIFQPHSLAEFNEMTAKNKLKVPADLSFDSSELQRLEDPKDGLDFINEQLQLSFDFELI